MTTEHVAHTSTGLEYGPPLSPEELEKMSVIHRQFSADRKLLASMRDDLLKQYDGQFIAMHHGRFFHAADHETLFRLLQSEGVEPGRTVIKFLSTKPRMCWHG